MFWSRLFHWFFYGHFLIATAAAGLAWLSVEHLYPNLPLRDIFPALAFVFFATLGIYTLHRLLSFRRAGIRPTAVRYEIVRRHPDVSLFIGLASGCIAGITGLLHFMQIYFYLLWALPITIFYLTPPYPGWRRLRDLPYLKVIWVGLAWTIVTVNIPIEMVDKNHTDLITSNAGYFSPIFSDQVIRFLFTTSIALLFDFRDVVLDRSQGVRTVACEYPSLTKVLVSTSMLICILITFYDIDNISSSLIAAYLATILIGWLTHEKRTEDWYAVVVNGALLLPPLFYLFDRLSAL